MRRIINKNQELIQKQEEEHDNNMNNSFSDDDSINNDNVRDLMAEWSSEQDNNTTNNAYTPAPSSPGARALFSGSPVSPITGRVLDESVRDDYNSILGHESLDVSRDPIMDSLHLSDLQGPDNNDSQSERLRRQRSPSFEEESGINLFGNDDDDSHNESIQLPQQQALRV